MSTVRWTARATADLIAVGDHLAFDKPRAARAWVERLRERAWKASKVPRAGRVVPEIDREDIREVFVRSYRIIYRVVPGGIAVLTVFEGHRLLGELDVE